MKLDWLSMLIIIRVNITLRDGSGTDAPRRKRSERAISDAGAPAEAGARGGPGASSVFGDHGAPTERVPQQQTDVFVSRVVSEGMGLRSFTYCRS